MLNQIQTQILNHRSPISNAHEAHESSGISIGQGRCGSVYLSRKFSWQQCSTASQPSGHSDGPSALCGGKVKPMEALSRWSQWRSARGRGGPLSTQPAQGSCSPGSRYSPGGLGRSEA